MSELSAEIEVESVQVKEGVSQKTGKPWKLYRVETSAGTAYSTFDANLGSLAYAAVGRRAQIKYRTTEKGNDLISLIVDENSVAAVEPVRAQTPAGNPDWDMIGLHKTRCALWVAAIGAGLDVGVARQAVIAAEVDIFHRQPAEESSDLPFEMVPEDVPL